MQFLDDSRVPYLLDLMFNEIYTGIARESSRTYELNQTYELGGIKDYDGNPHANTGVFLWTNTSINIKV